MSTPNYDYIRKFYINLDSREDRRQSMEAQVGDDFTRVSAVYAKELSPAEIEAQVDLPYVNTWYKVDLTLPQIGCTLSHHNIYKQIASDDSIADDDWVLISEDDTKFIPDFKQRLEQLLEYLKSPQVEQLELVLLRYYIFDQAVDWADAHADYRKTGIRPTGLWEKYITHTLKQSLRVHGKNQRLSFDYQGLPEPDSELYSNNQKLIFVDKFSPWSSGLYLIRKRSCKRIITLYPKIWWITDDFHRIVPIEHMAILSPGMGFDAEVANISDIQDEEAQQRILQTKIHHRIDNKIYTFNKAIFPWFYSWYYSTSPWKRKISKGMIGMIRKCFYDPYATK